MKAYDYAETCDLMIILGSSLVVYPAAQLPNVAIQCGAKMIIINLEPTEKDYLAEIVINNHRIGEVLPRIIEKIKV